MKKSKKAKIIIPIVAVLLAVAIAVPVYFFVIKKSSVAGQENRSEGGGSDTKISIDAGYEQTEISYETAEYKGYTLPADIADCLLAADEDNAAACEKYGVAMKIGDLEISTPEYMMVYYDTFNTSVNEATGDENDLIVNSTKLPSEQPYGDFGYNWDTQLRTLTEEELTERFLMFDEAFENGFVISDGILDEFNLTYTTVCQSATSGGYSSPDELCEAAYTKGVTVEMYMRQFVLYAVLNQYKADLAQKAVSECTDEEAEKIYLENKDEYDYVDAIIVTINLEDSDFVNSHISDVKDLDSLYQCCLDYYEEHNYPIDLAYAKQLCNWGHSNKKGLESKLGKNISEWCYDDSRKAGDIGVVEGEIYWCIIYLESEPYDSYSVDIHEMAFYYDAETLTTSPTDEQKEATQEALLEAKKAFTETDMTLEDFIAVTQNYGEGDNAANGGALTEQRIPDLDYDTAYWCFTEKPESGDWTVLYTPEGCSLFFFDRANTEDKDSLFYVRSQVAAEQYDEYLESVKNYNGNETVSYGDEVEKAIKAAEEHIQATIDARNEAINEALGQTD